MLESSSFRQSFMAEGGPLALASQASERVADRWRHSLTPEDSRMLIQGFFLAESMARFAIVHAQAQLPEEYRRGLQEQCEDENRHIQVFADWLPLVPEVPEPGVKQRQIPLWLLLLLVNELTGFCQFRLLTGLLVHADRRDAVEKVMDDERIHIVRLLDWLEPLWSSRTARPLGQYLESFRRHLPGRMCQFFPRDALQPLRLELVAVIDTLLSHLPPTRRSLAAVGVGGALE